MGLSAKKLNLIDALIANPLLSDVKLAEMLNVNNKTVGKWQKDEEVQAELKKRLSEKWKNAERIAVNTMIKRAGNGDYKAAAYILDSLDYCPTQKIELSSDININIDG